MLKGPKVKEKSKSNEMIQISGTEIEMRECRAKEKYGWCQEQTVDN